MYIGYSICAGTNLTSEEFANIYSRETSCWNVGEQTVSNKFAIFLRFVRIYASYFSILPEVGYAFALMYIYVHL